MGGEVVVEECPFCGGEVGATSRMTLVSHLRGTPECRRRGREILERRATQHGRPAAGWGR